jgi:hypothetical protein
MQTKRHAVPWQPAGPDGDAASASLVGVFTVVLAATAVAGATPQTGRFRATEAVAFSFTNRQAKVPLVAGHVGRIAVASAAA